MSTLTVWMLMSCIVGTALGQTNCNDGDVRLVGGTSPLNGRVEVCYNNQWGGVCSRYTWSQNQATVVCRQLGYPFDAVAYSSGYGAATSTFLNVDDCDIRADQLLDCYSNGNAYSPSTLGYYTCSGYNNFVVNCTSPIPEYCSGTCINGSIRLVGGPSPYKGRVEVCVEGCWGTVCGNDFDVSDASVVCHQLGFPSFGATPILNGYYGKGSGPIWLYSLSCIGNESSLFDCSHSANSYYYYNYYYYYYYYYLYFFYRSDYYTQLNDYNLCNHNSDVAVHCAAPTSTCSNGDVRLVNGSTPMEGRVEVCIGQQWGAVCGDGRWTSDTSGANTVCEQLGFSPSNATAYVYPYFGSETSGIFLLNVHCDARAGRLVDCSYSYQHGFQYCYSGYTAGVRCQGIPTSVCIDGTVRLAGGLSPYEGRVEVCAHGTWGTVCSYNWDIRDASVVCRQLGYKAAGVFLYYSQYGLGTGPVWFNNVNCIGAEQRLIDCPVISNNNSYCDHYNDAAVQCTATVQNCTDWDIRLVGGSSPLQGRVEVCYMNQWGTICGYSDSVPTFANVICRQLGYSYYNPTVYYYSYFGRGSGGIYLYTSTLVCTGNETRLQDCYHSPLGYHQCYDHYTDIGVQCQAGTIGSAYTPCVSGSFRLVGGSSPSVGRVEICLGGNWSTICGYPSHWEQGQAAVICQQLGFKPSGAELVYSGIFGQGGGLSVYIEAQCTGNETSFLQCSSSYNYICYDHTHDIGVRCAPAVSSQCLDGDVRLVNATNGTLGPGIIEGVVQICYAGRWGVVTGSAWTLSEASVVCRQLHYAPVALKALVYSRDIATAGNIAFSQFYCAGNEKKILDCYHDPPGYYNSYYNTYVAVRCQASCLQCQDGSVRLVGGNSSYEGRVEVCEGGCWGPVCIGDSGWSSLDAAVVCNQLKMGSQGAVPRYYYSLTSHPILAPHCTGYESSLFNCAQSACHVENYNYAGIACSPDANICVRGTRNCTSLYNNTVKSCTCSCNTGFALAADNRTCNDINECVLGTSGCTQLCNNTIGSYICYCKTGYTLQIDNHTCIDINECTLGTSGCTQLCTNTVGSYTCSCNTGYSLHADSHTCNDINECVLGTSACTQLCNNIVGSYTCACSAGYKLDADNHTCSDINECVLGTSGCTQLCNNTIGSYTCYCNTGYKFDADNHTCKDINECLNAEACSSQVCTNTNGSYICSCNPGSILSADMKTCAAFPATLNTVAVTVAGYTVDSFIQTIFISTVQYIIEVYCIDDRCSSQTMNAQYIVTIKSITNTAVGIMVILQVQTSNTVLSATVVTQVLTERKNTLAAGGFIIVSVAPHSEPASTVAPYSEPASKLSLEGTVAVIVVPTVVVSVILAVVLVLLFMCCCQNSRRKLKFNVTTAEGMTGIQELHTMDAGSLAKKTPTSFNTYDNIAYDVTNM